MHSGIGPASQLEKFKIPVVHDVPAIGQGLRDRGLTLLVHSRTENSTDRKGFYGSQTAMDQALEQWKRDKTGGWTEFGCEMDIGWYKLPEIESLKEFKDLPKDTQKYLLKETVPHYEMASHFPVHWFIPGFPPEALGYSCLLGFFTQPQSRGEVTLQSTDPNVPLLFDPKFLSHPFDRAIAAPIIRQMFKIINHPDFAKDTLGPIAVPASDSDEDLLEYWRQTLLSSWHMSGTIKMGKPRDPDAAVNSDFQLMGIENLRVADMSVSPVLPSAHIQAAAYMTGLTCAEKLIKEYRLDKKGSGECD
jgi:choline dehydrogenase-like flavoprotein